MALIKWTPFPLIDSFDEMEKAFENWPVVSNSFTPALDVYEEKDNVVVEVPLAGIDPEKLDVSIENNVLTIKGENEKKSEVEDKNYYRKEVRWGSFYRSVALPTKVNGDGAEANYDQGVLTIRVPKAEEVKPKTIKIATSKK
ncbi:MAG: Spore protein SP21 [Parcubacteria group bacterium ADurb.Bin326]|nr:MAG: Spore protein SP21 [Parcubacteria group bacterium ADurb.Bin326]